MTEHPEPLSAAIADRDITLALTPGQLLMAVVALWLLMRFLRSLRN
jgi:hypothetical protein